MVSAPDTAVKRGTIVMRREISRLYREIPYDCYEVGAHDCLLGDDCVIAVLPQSILSLRALATWSSAISRNRPEIRGVDKPEDIGTDLPETPVSLG